MCIFIYIYIWIKYMKYIYTVCVYKCYVVLVYHILHLYRPLYLQYCTLYVYIYIYTCIYRDTLPIAQVDVAWDLGCSAPKNLRLGKVGIGVSTRLRKSSASVPWCLLRSGKARFWCFLPAKITNSCFEQNIDDVQFRFGWCQTEKLV